MLAELPLPLHAENVEVERRRADTVNGAVIDGDARLGPFFVVLLWEWESSEMKLQAIGTLQGTNISPKMGFWRCFSFSPKVGYVSSLEGRWWIHTIFSHQDFWQISANLTDYFPTKNVFFSARLEMNIKPLRYDSQWPCKDRNGVTGSKVLQKGRPETQGVSVLTFFFFWGVMSCTVLGDEDDSRNLLKQFF